MNKEAKAQEQLKSLNLPNSFLEMWDDKFPTGMYCRSSPANYVKVANEMSEVISGLSHLLPLWVDNGDSVVGICMRTKKYLKFYYEDGGTENPNEHIEYLGNNYQQFITSFLLEEYDAGLEEKVDFFAEVFEYKHLDKLKELCENYQGDGDEVKIEAFKNSLS